MRKGIERCGRKCNPLAEKLQHLWDRTIGSITKINNITPDGEGKFTIEAGENITVTETGTGNGIRIDATGGGGGSDYTAIADSGIVIDNQAHTIGTEDIIRGSGDIGSYTTPIRIVNGRAEAIGYEVAKQSDLQTIFGQLMLILDGTTKVPNAQRADLATNATNAQFLGSDTASVGSDTKPVKIVNGQAVAVSNDVLTTDSNQLIPAGKIQNQKQMIKGIDMNRQSLSVSFGHADIQIVDSNNLPIAILRVQQQGANISLYFGALSTQGVEQGWTEIAKITRT